MYIANFDYICKTHLTKMEKLVEFSRSRIYSVNTVFKRYLWEKINWNNRLIAVTGARGVGKTTMLLQYIRENLNERPDEVIYVNLDVFPTSLIF